MAIRSQFRDGQVSQARLVMAICGTSPETLGGNRRSLCRPGVSRSCWQPPSPQQGEACLRMKQHRGNQSPEKGLPCCVLGQTVGCNVLLCQRRTSFEYLAPAMPESPELAVIGISEPPPPRPWSFEPGLLSQTTNCKRTNSHNSEAGTQTRTPHWLVESPQGRTSQTLGNAGSP